MDAQYCQGNWVGYYRSIHYFLVVEYIFPSSLFHFQETVHTHYGISWYNKTPHGIVLLNRSQFHESVVLT